MEEHSSRLYPGYIGWKARTSGWKVQSNFDMRYVVAAVDYSRHCGTDLVSELPLTVGIGVYLKVL